MMHQFNRKMLKSIIAASLLCLASQGTSIAKTPPLKGLIEQETLWPEYKAKFMAKNGRIVDNGNKNISHSEGQGFAMLMALAANDPIAFDRIWRFTASEMMIRKDSLIAWRWSPNGFVRVTDRNNATDGDLLVAWALLEAAKSGFEPSYRNEGLAILKSLKPLAKKDGQLGWWLRPGKHGFSSADQGGHEVINMSYWVFPALERLSELSGQPIWRSVAASGENILASASRNKAGLPADWNAFKRGSGIVGTSYKFGTDFSYNAIRVPLYLAWSGKDRTASLNRFHTQWVNRGGSLSRIDVKRNKVKGTFVEKGYKAVAAVVNCSLNGTAFPSSMKSNLDKLYYPASLHILSVIATKQRYPQCW